MKFLLSLVAVLFLGACQHSYTAESWEAEIVSNFKVSAKARQQAGRDMLPWDNLFLQEPQVYAASEAAAGRYGLYSFAMGYQAEAKDAALFGIDCGIAKVETIPLVFGCMPPSGVFFKRVFDYNTAMMAQPGFPHAAACKVDESIQGKESQWLEKEVETANEQQAMQIKKWRNAEKRAYNP